MENQERLRKMVTEAVCRALEERHKVSLPKKEHMTCLRGDIMVYKDHPRIAFRGAVDSLEADIIRLQILTEKRQLKSLTQDLEEIIRGIRHLLRCEVSGEPVGEMTFLGLTLEELREHSHHPGKYYGKKHFLPSRHEGEITAELNYLRTRAREAELIAYQAFKRPDKEPEREDILRVFNRLSSLFWIMMFRYLTGKYEEGQEDENG